jgi:hypothetical protein
MICGILVCKISLLYFALFKSMSAISNDSLILGHPGLRNTQRGIVPLQTGFEEINFQANPIDFDFLVESLAPKPQEKSPN